LWYGDWRLEGTGRVREIKTIIDVSGPVWAQVRVQYVFEKGDQSYDIVFRATSGEPWIDVTEKYRLGGGAQMTLSLWERLHATDALWMPWFVGHTNWVEQVGDVRRLHLAEKAPPDRGVFATLRPRWTQARDSSAVCLAVGDGPGSPSVGAAMTCPAEWQRPYEQFVTARALAEGRGMAMDFPLAEGRRRWAILAGPVARFDSRAKLESMIRRGADMPLDRVLNEYVLEWTRGPDKFAPHILTTDARLRAIRTEGAAGGTGPVAALVGRVLAGKSPGDRTLAELIAGRRKDVGNPQISVAERLARGYQGDWKATPAWSARLAEAMRTADLSAADGYAGGTSVAMIGYMFTDPNFVAPPGSGWNAGRTDSSVDLYAPAVYAAAMMPDHPHAKRWMTTALANLRDDFRRAVAGPGGPAAESPGTEAAALAARLPLMRAAQNSGLDDPMRWPELRQSVEFLRNLHTPPDPRLGRRMLVPFGGTEPWQDAAGAVFGMAAAGARSFDQPLAAAWMAMYRDYYGDTGSGDLARDLLVVDQSIPAAKFDPGAWTSRRMTGFGAVLRSRAGTPSETFAAFKCGAATGEYRGDEMAFHFYGAGMPIALDWSSGGRPRPEQEHMHNRSSLGDSENLDAIGELAAMAETPAADVAVGQVRGDRLRRMPQYPGEITAHESFPRRQLPSQARYRRYLMLVKHPAARSPDEAGPMEDYLVIRDEFVSTEPATFNLFVLARSVRQDDRTFFFDGQLAADAALFMAAPDPDKVRTDRWGWPKTDDALLVPKDFRIGADRWRVGELQQWVRIAETPGRPFLAVLYPYRKGTPPPKFEVLAGGRGVRVTVGGASEEVYLATDPPPEAGGQAAIRRDGQTTVIMKPKTVPAL